MRRRHKKIGASERTFIYCYWKRLPEEKKEQRSEREDRTSADQRKFKENDTNVPTVRRKIREKVFYSYHRQKEKNIKKSDENAPLSETIKEERLERRERTFIGDKLGVEIR